MNPLGPYQYDDHCEYPLANGHRLRFRHATREYHPDDAWIYFSRLLPHSHSDLHIVIPLSGKNTYHLNGKEIEWEAHQGVLINSDELHEVRPLKPGALEYTQITFVLLGKDGQPVATTWSTLSEQLGGKPIELNHIQRKTWQAVTPDLLAAVEALQARDAMGVTGRVLNILSRLGVQERGVRPPELMLLEERIHQDLKRAWTTDALAGLCGWSTGYLHRRCRKVYQCTPMERVYQIRLDRAQSLLLEGQIQLQAIATLCGFTDAYHFSRRFKKRYGVAPGRWRRLYMSHTSIS